MILNILLNYKASHFRATTIVITKTWIIYFLYNLMQDFGFSWPVRKPHSIPADVSLSLHKLLTEVWAAGQSLVTRQDQDVVCDRAVDENPGVGWHWWTWSSVKCGHKPCCGVILHHLSVTQRKHCCHNELQLVEDVSLCLHLKDRSRSSHMLRLSSLSHTSVVPSLAASADWQKCFSLKYDRATEKRPRDLEPLSKAQWSQTQGTEKAFWPESSDSETESSQTHFTISLSFHIFQAPSRA